MSQEKAPGDGSRIEPNPEASARKQSPLNQPTAQKSCSSHKTDVPVEALFKYASIGGGRPKPKTFPTPRPAPMNTLSMEHATEVRRMTRIPNWKRDYDGPPQNPRWNQGYNQNEPPPIFFNPPRHHSLPTTHIRYEKNKHTTNIAEKEKATLMLRKAAAESPLEELPEIPHPDIEMTTTVKVLVPVEEYSGANIAVLTEKLLERCSAKIVKWIKDGKLPRAPYEQQMVVFELKIVLAPFKGITTRKARIAEFAGRFSRVTVALGRQQLLLEFPKISEIFNSSVPQHTDVTVLAVALGNCPHIGMFFDRGDYAASDNEICNLCVPSSAPPDNDVTRENHAFKIAGKHRYTSFSRFEHDRRILFVYFGVQVQNSNIVEGIKISKDSAWPYPTTLSINWLLTSASTPTTLFFSI
ncbi:unnamed protein product [Caenorhabditis auriculariae]|uniref:PH-like domain-containing protein n=1 Tax=Caenorhabditis auriculariae TaxID=2777116 RepID=A0A8S1H7H2_9PELO|nr:unnamed protein product [Caenorhabditis auriculariae]